MTLSRYQFQAELHRSERSIVERGLLSGRSVVVKRLNRQYPLPADLADYQREYDVLQHIQSDWVIKGYSLNAEQHALILVLEDIGGQSLRQLYQEQALPLDQFLDIAIAITQGLAHIHAAQVIHKDINPGNIVLNPTTGQLRIIDFGLSSRIRQETTMLQHPNTLEGTLPYLSPEQTGRVNRLIDYRTDIYSLGATFYELLTGSLPFTTTDPMALVHSHLAKLPPSVSELRPEIPDFLAAMVAKMMAKSAEERYQSAWGIQADLERIQERLSRGLALELPIAQDDYPFQFRLPQTLYGRETELKRLLASFEEIRCAHGTQLVLVTGYSGIGKSSLVRELYRPITAAQGYFATGKFDQLQRAVPYAALIKAFSGLLRQLLGESAAQLEVLRSHLLIAVGNSGQVIIDVIPDLELVIGSQPAVPALAPAESQNRFSNIFQRFVRVFARSEHPLVLFLDDLQWADTASLNLLHLLLSDTQTESLLIIGAYRSNEISDTHPLMRTLAGLDSITPTILTLSPLALPHICQLLADTLHQELQTVEPLAQLILEKTRGNPFFVNEFLKTLEAEQLIRFDLSQRRWHWQLAQIQAQEITDNVVVLMTRKLQKLSSVVQQLLCIAACIGASFDIDTLSLVAEQDPTEIRNTLASALQSGLILASEQTQELTFLHDRVQQAAYNLLDSGEKSALHLRIGQHLQPQLATLPEKLFEVVDHLNLGRSQLSPERWLEVAQLNLEAGQRAKQATAYQAAEQYLAAGVEYLRKTVSLSLNSLTYDLHREWAEVQYLLGEFDASQSTIDYLLQQDLSPLQQAEVYNLRIVQNTIQTNYQTALAAGKEALAVLGVTLPLTDLEASFNGEYAKLQENLADRSLPSLADLPAITDPEKIFAVELLSNLGSAAYRYDRRVWQLIVVLSINLFLEYGNVPQSCYGYSNYGTLLGSVLGDYQAGYESARLSLRLSENYCDRTQTSRACFILSNFVQSWVRPVSEADAVNQAGVDAGLETGEFQYVGYTLSYRISNLFFQGKPLSEVMVALQEAMQFCRQVKNQWAIDALLGYQLTIQQLLGESLSGIDPDYIQACHDNNSLSGLCRYYILQGLALYLDRQPAEALAMLDKATPMLDFILGVVCVADYHFYRAVLLAELPASSDTLLQQIETHRTWLHQRAAICPENFLQKAQLLEAELARLKGQQWDAIQHYDAAITNAVSHQFLQDEAIVCERAALFWLDYDKTAFAQPYLRQAHYAFMRWGAAQKVTQMEQEFPSLQSINDLELNPAAITKRISGNTFSDTLDLSSLLKASQTISSEIVLERLTRELMEILVENAGAQRGYLLLKDGADLRIEAHSGGGNAPVAEIAQDPNQLPLSLINYVIRTEQAVVLNDAAITGDFAHDPYIRLYQPKSIFCVPLLHQGNLTGLVYFEHFLAPNAFTRDRLEVIVLLSSQAAISIQNAQLYNTLEQKVIQRTQALAAERAKSEKLLQNILPVAIAERLKENERAIADGFEEVSVLFCDIVGCTGLSSQISPTELVDFLNQVFSVFDQLCDRHQLEKIKTVGDAYIAVGGLPGSAVDHGGAIANMALDMVQSLQSFTYPNSTPLQVRIGIHIGPVVAGVIGTKKFAYDLWGDTVNVASRMESQGTAGKIQVTPTVYEKLTQRYTFERRGAITVKGKGKMTTYWLTGKKASSEIEKNNDLLVD